jgi:hypothetical protein
LREYYEAMGGLFDVMLGSVQRQGEEEEGDGGEGRKEEGGTDGEGGGSTRGRQRRDDGQQQRRQQQQQQREQHHPHFIVRTTHPFGKPCYFKGGNAKVHWLNHMAQLQAEAYNLTLMDSYRLFFAEDRLRDAGEKSSEGGERAAANVSSSSPSPTASSSCGDGLHCSKKYVKEKDDDQQQQQQNPPAHCRKCVVQAQILLQYLFFQVVGRE